MLQNRLRFKNLCGQLFVVFIFPRFQQKNHRIFYLAACTLKLTKYHIKYLKNKRNTNTSFDSQTRPKISRFNSVHEWEFIFGYHSTLTRLKNLNINETMYEILIVALLRKKKFMCKNVCNSIKPRKYCALYSFTRKW